MAAAERPPARPGPSPRFSREQVLEKALEVIESGPPEEFSMRRLGDALGIKAMTLYGYVENKNDALEGAALLALSRYHQEPDRAAPWHEQLRTMLREIYLVCRRHPHLAALVISRNASSPGLLRLRERMLGILLGAGFDKRRALHALGVLAYYTSGFAGAQAGLGQSGAQGALSSLDPAEFPHLTALADTYDEHASEEAFEFGMRHLLDGLRRQVEQS